MRVVLVDPSAEAAAHVARLLEARHHEVRTFADGREALAYIQADTKVSAVITGTAVSYTHLTLPTIYSV